MKNEFNHIVKELSNIYPNKEAKSIAYLVFREKLGYHAHDIHLGNQKPDFKQKKELESILSELLSGKPVQYILGYTWFYDLKFKVNRNVLIPRPETEELVHFIIDHNRSDNPSILDIGTGSGCIPISLKKSIPESHIQSIDISIHAIQTARENAEMNNTMIHFLQMDILKKTEWDNLPFSYDIIVSNPPYITHSEKKLMHKNVLDFEPPSALFVEDRNPLIFYDVISDFALEKLNKNGWLFYEINENSGLAIKKLLEKKGFLNVHISKDIHEKNRFISCHV